MRRMRAGIGIWLLGLLFCASGYAQTAPPFPRTGPAFPPNAPAWPREAAPRPLAAREFKFPPYEVRTLPNGLRVVIVLHHEQPAVTMRLLVGAGAAQDPEKKSGTANLVA